MPAFADGKSNHVVKRGLSEKTGCLILRRILKKIIK